MKRDKIIYWVSTGIFSLLILMGVGMYFGQHDEVVKMYESFGYPPYLIYPLGTVKVLGLIAIWTNKSKMLKEWAYAGFVFELMLGAGAHISVNDGGHYAAILVLICVIISYIFNKRIYKEEVA
ncbi:MAG: DoxX family protein [Flavobacteriales bacterium]|nr:DoxX family protein [Flavobacteriales bacterium]